LAAHLVGHLGKVNSAELQRREIHSADDWVGRMGLEKLFDTQLRGTRGKQHEVRDRRGRQLSSRVTQPAQSGRKLTLTIDSRVQRSAEKLLDQALERGPTANRDAHIAGGAVVVLDCQTGQVLACASAPRFDPNVMLGGSPAALEPLLAGAHRPLFDRATKMALPPGSVMKLVTAAALLESGAVTADEQFHCQGFLHQPDRQRCYLFRHHGVGHGRITLTDALAQSCNVYFFHHATRMGHRPLIDWAYRFGLGQRTGIELPGETSGRVPTPRSMEKLEDREWTASDTQALSIGQSSLTVTPLQMARLVAAVANGGRLVRPRLLVQQDETADSYPDDPLVGLSESTLKAIRTGMRLAVADPSGTAHEVLASASVHVAAKTGTAETGNSKGDHAWIAAYAPATAPKIALVVVLEHAGSGSTAAGPVANRLVLRLDQLGYFSRPDARVARHPNKTE
jgi:penicillin-binding protein 2